MSATSPPTRPPTSDSPPPRRATFRRRSRLRLWFGRKLARYRERRGDVRDEDLMTWEKFEALFKD